MESGQGRVSASPGEWRREERGGAYLCHDIGIDDDGVDIPPADDVPVPTNQEASGRGTSVECFDVLGIGVPKLHHQFLPVKGKPREIGQREREREIVRER